VTLLAEFSIARRLLAFYLDQLVALLGMIPVAIIGSAVAIMVFNVEIDSLFEPLISPFLLSYCVVQFAYQYWSLLTGNPTIGQVVGKFYVDADSKKFQTGFVQIYLGRIGINLSDGKSTFWPATVHVVLASLSVPFLPIALLLALADPENRFWWARISGTSTVDMKAALRVNSN